MNKLIIVVNEPHYFTDGKDNLKKGQRLYYYNF